MTELSELPPSERAKRYRELAREAERQAERSTGSTREGYLFLAKGWEGLAQAIDAEIGDKGEGGKS